MVDITAERVVIEVIARLDKAKADVKGMDAQVDTSAKSMQRSAKALEGHLEQLGASSVSSFAKVGTASKGAANDVDTSSRRIANAQRNIARQFADIGAQAAGGQNPALIFAQQAPQIADALADTGGRAAKVASFFAGPWGAALLAAGSVLGTLIPRLLDAGDAANTMTAAQIDLARFVDTTTGAINRQTTAVQRLAAAQARQGEVESGTRNYTTSRSRAISAARDAAGVRDPVFTAGFRQPEAVVTDPLKQRIRDLAAAAAAGKLPINDFALAIRGAVGDRPEYRALVKTVTAQAAAAVTAAQGVQRLKAEQAVLTGTATAQQKALLGLGQVTTGLVEKQVALATATSTLEKARARLALVEERGRSIAAGDNRSLAQYRTDLTAATRAVNHAEAAEKNATLSKRDHAKASREAAKALRQQEQAARLAARAEHDLLGLRGDLLSAKSDLTSDSRQQDEFARQRINLDRAGRTSVEAERLDRGELTKAEFAERKKLIDEIADARVDLVNRNEGIRFANEQLAAAQAGIANQQEILTAQSDLATTAKARREIELKLLDLAIEEQRLAAQKVVDLAAAGRASPEDAALARGRLDALPQIRDLGRERINRETEGPLGQYGQQLRRATDDMSTALEGVAADGLQSLEDGLASVISGTQSLGDAFSNMATRIIADLARIAIQKAILSAIGEAGGSGGETGAAGGVGGFLAGLFGGARAAGGPVSSGKTYLVGERGPELLRMQGAGTVIPNDRVVMANPGALAMPRNAVARPQPASTTVMQTIQVDARGAVMNDKFATLILEQANQSARQIAGGAYKAAIRDAPAYAARMAPLHG